MPNLLNDTQKRGNASEVYSQHSPLKRFILIIFLGFSSGLPFALIGTTLQAWFSVSGLSLMSIGLLSLIGQPYLYKFLWAPLLDRHWFMQLGRRRGWVLVCQLSLVVSIFALAQLQPQNMPWTMASFALVVAFFSATQDVVVDAYRTELLQSHERGLGASVAVLAYRLATLVSGGLALILASEVGFSLTYMVMAACLIPSLVVNFFISEKTNPLLAKNIQQRPLLLPLLALIQNPKARALLLFILLYKLGEAFTSTSSGISMHFLLNGLGFSLKLVGVVNKGIGIFATILGSIVAGILMLRLSLYQALMSFGVIQVVANATFILLAMLGKHTGMMVIAVFFDNAAAGLGMTALVALMMAMCDTDYTATQLAILSAISSLPRVAAGPLGAFVQPLTGWVGFYLAASVAAMPAIWVLYRLRYAEVFNE